MTGSVIVTDAGFRPEDWEAARLLPLDRLSGGEALPDGPLGVDLPNDADPACLAPWLDRLGLVRIAFPAMGDGRGFSLAARLRSMGYRGRLRAAGPLVADQYAAARRTGFDEVEIPAALAARQPAARWRAPARPTYRERLRLRPAPR